MRFKTFLESNDPRFGPVSSAEEAAQLIYKECQPYLKESGVGQNFYDRGLLRGMGHLGPDVVFDKMKVNRQRAPKDSHPKIHAILNQHFDKKFGEPFRTTGVFASGKLGIASDYGIVFMMLPIGDFDYLWSPRVDDAFNFFDGSKYGTDPLVLKEYPQHFTMKDLWHMEDLPQLFRDYQVQLTKALEKDGFGYKKNVGLREALDEGNEIMVSCSSYFVLYHDIPAHVNMETMRESNEVIKHLVGLIRG